MSPIKDLHLVYEYLNEDGTFSEGDTITGTVSFTVTEATKVKGLMVKAKGDVNVHWTRGSGDSKKSYSAHERYFKVKEYLIAETGTDLPKGDHRFSFHLQIPQGDMPSSFKGIHGKIVYILEAKMSRSWRWPTTVKEELKFVSKNLLHLGQVMCPQSGSVDKETGVFSKRLVQMSATVDRKFCSPGDTISIVAQISNSSSKEMKPKFSLNQKVVYHASGSTQTDDQCLCKMIGEVITEKSERTVTCQMEIPPDVLYALHNCEHISVEHYLKVYLDISFAFDPEVVFPLGIVPSSMASLQPDEAAEPYSAWGAGAPGYSYFPPPAVPM
uniref:arrestin domain-containing protein 2-like n=1 Tax=Epinephelus lanceolatus TaxID=310571 RepID=UPI001445A361|nr:arrestin domain-containing protein 2-like [Epinephelus lanceolatus]